MAVGRRITPISKEEYIKAYDFIDTITGKGVAVLYLSTTGQSTGREYVLLGYKTDSDTEYTEQAATAGTGDVDFDMVAEQAFWLEGEAVFNFAQMVHHAGGSDATQYLIIKIRKYDGTTETDIANVQSDSISNGAGSDTFAREQCQVTIPKTFVAAGNTIRITIEQYTGGDNANSYGRFYHDPNSRTAPTGTMSSMFVAYIPILIQG